MATSTKFYFTDREKDVIELLKLGYTNPEIAKKLYIATSSVKYHISNIIRKTNAINRINVIFILGMNGYFKDSELA